MHNYSLVSHLFVPRKSHLYNYAENSHLISRGIFFFKKAKFALLLCLVYKQRAHRPYHNVDTTIEDSQALSIMKLSVMIFLVILFVLIHTRQGHSKTR